MSAGAMRSEAPWLRQLLVVAILSDARGAKRPWSSLGQWQRSARYRRSVDISARNAVVWWKKRLIGMDTRYPQ